MEISKIKRLKRPRIKSKHVTLLPHHKDFRGITQKTNKSKVDIASESLFGKK